MAYKYDGKYTCFIEDGMVLAINICNSGLLDRKYYNGQGLTDDRTIDAIIAARRELFSSIVHAIAADAKKKVFGRHQEKQESSAAGGSGGVAEEQEVVDIGPGPQASLHVPPRSNNYPTEAEAILPASGDRGQDEPKLSVRMSNDQELQWMQDKSRVENDIAAEKAARKRKELDEDVEAEGRRKIRAIELEARAIELEASIKSKKMEVDPVVKINYELELFNKERALERAKEVAAAEKSKAALDKSKADAEKKTADRIAAEEKIKLAKALRAEEDEKQKRDEEMEAAYANAELDFINATGDTARLDSRNKLEKMMKRKHPDLSQRTRTMRINKLISKPKK
jgi:hypothetical protein